MASPSIQQTVTGDHNIFTATGDINVTYTLPPADAADHHNLTILLERVNAFWVEGVLEHSVIGEMAHELLKEHVVDAVEHPWESVLEVPGRDAQILDRAAPVKPIFDSVGRSMLILGDPGAGKTIALLELARDLVAAARTDPSQPVPVVLNLSSWSGQPLERWLVDEMKTKYFVAERMGRPLLEKNRLALLLDGLDEVSAENQAACVEAINAFTESWGVPGLVVCSRLGEYTALPARLRLHGAIRLNALTREQVDGYLATQGGDLAGLRAALAEDESLAALARSPLMLSVMSVAYRGRRIEHPDEDERLSPESRREQIFDAYVEEMFARRGGGIDARDRARDEDWLASLARRMGEHSQSVFTIEGLQPSWLARRKDRLGYALRSRLAAGLILGIAEGLYVGGLGFMGNPFLVDFGRGVAVGILFGILIGLYDWARIEHGMRSTGKPRRGSVPMFMLSLVVYFLAFALPFAWLWRDSADVWTRLPFGFVWAAVFAARVRMPAARTDIRAVEAIAWSWRRAGIGAACGFGLGLLFSIGLVVVYEPGFESEAKRKLWTYPVLLPICYAFVGGLIGGLATKTLETKTMPNEGMRLSLRNARFAGLLVAGITGVGTVLYFLGPPVFFGDMQEILENAGGTLALVVATLYFTVLVCGYFGLLAALWFGGLDYIYHRMLVRSLARSGALPVKLEEYLERVSKLTLVQRVGGGYMFLHRLLLEHFAERSPDRAPAPRPATA